MSHTARAEGRSGRRRRRVLASAAVAVSIAYVLLLLLARMGYPRALYPRAYFPVGGDTDAAAVPGARPIMARASDGVVVHALAFDGPSGAPTVVYFHGNGETVDDDIPVARGLIAQGLSVVLVEYRGYGVSRGQAPSEAGLYADAEAVLARLAEGGVGPQGVVLCGHSLGSGVAAEMAVRGRGRALVLVSPYTSVTDVASRVAWFLPVEMLMAERFDTLGKAGRVRVPTLIVHGTDDEVIPFAMGERLSRAITGARLVRVEGGRHADLFRGGRPTFGDVAAFARASTPTAR